MLIVFGDHQAHLSEESELADLLTPEGGKPPDARSPNVLAKWQASKDVPLLIRLPGAALAGAYDNAGGHVDIAPTLLSLAGIQDDLGGVMLGRDLLGAETRPVVFREGSVATDSTVFIRSADATFDLTSGELAVGTRSQFAEIAARELRASDTIVRGNLVPRFLTNAPRAVRPPRPVRTLAIAHRGDSANAPENTLLAIDMAFEAGADAVEVDIRLSRDGVPVIFHEDDLDYTTNGSGPAAARTLAELKELDAGSWKDARFRGEKIPALEEALAVARGRGRLLFDVKADGMAASVASIYRRLGVPESEAMVGAWTQEQVVEFAQEMPGATLLRSHGTLSSWNIDYFEWLKTFGVGGIELGEIWPPTLVDAVRSAGLLAICYTVNDEGTMRRLIRMGVDGIETDHPALAVRLCRSVPDEGDCQARAD
jgi:glycerophosphoryl diester phosphodiesterase